MLFIVNNPSLFGLPALCNACPVEFPPLGGTPVGDSTGRAYSSGVSEKQKKDAPPRHLFTP